MSAITILKERKNLHHPSKIFCPLMIKFYWYLMTLTIFTRGDKYWVNMKDWRLVSPMRQLKNQGERCEKTFEKLLRLSMTVTYIGFNWSIIRWNWSNGKTSFQIIFFEENSSIYRLSVIQRRSTLTFRNICHWSLIKHLLEVKPF